MDEQRTEPGRVVQMPTQQQAQQRQISALEILQQIGAISSSLLALQSEVMQMGKVLGAVAQKTEIIDNVVHTRLVALESKLGMEFPPKKTLENEGEKNATDKERKENNGVDA